MRQAPMVTLGRRLVEWRGVGALVEFDRVQLTRHFVQLLGRTSLSSVYVRAHREAPLARLV